MGRFRFSIGWLMIVVAVLALDFTVARAWSRSGSNSNADVAFVFGIPMLNILAIGFVIGRRRQGRARAFWTGFNRFGCLAVAALALDVFANHRRVLNEYEELVFPILHAFDKYLKHWDEDTPGFWLVVVPFLFSITLPPLLLPALVGGWIVSRLSPNQVSDRHPAAPARGYDRGSRRDRPGFSGR